MQGFEPLSIIDGHFHMYMSMDRIDLVANLGNLIEALGLEAIAVMSTAGVGRINQNLVAALCKAMHPDKVYAFGGLHYHLPAIPDAKIDLVEQARLLQRIGFDGMKMLEGKPTQRQKLGHRLDAPLYNDFYAYLESERIPLLFHVADPDPFWEREAYSGLPLKEDLYAEVDGILNRFPQLRIIFAHFYFLAHDLERAGRFLDQHPNVSIDLTPGSEMYFSFSESPEKARDFFIRYQDRIVFGTDNHGEARDVDAAAPLESWPYYKIKAMRTFLETDQAFQAWHHELIGIALDPPVLEKIYRQNFLRYVDPKPRKLNLTLALETCERILDLARRYAVVHDILPELRQFMDCILNAAKEG